MRRPAGRPPRSQRASCTSPCEVAGVSGFARAVTEAADEVFNSPPRESQVFLAVRLGPWVVIIDHTCNGKGDDAVHLRPRNLREIVGVTAPQRLILLTPFDQLLKESKRIVTGLD